MPWWGSSHGEDTGATPTAATFVRTEQPTEDASGFVSLMDQVDLTPAVSPSSAKPGRQVDFSADDDDLGLGNSQKALNHSPVAGSEKAAPREPQKRPELANPPASSGWLSRIWGRSGEQQSGPVKANLGEETAFHYDKDLKRWVNKKGGASSTPSTPPPPPQKAQQQSGPVKANLGDETSFYYDKELKRWVNKKAGATPSGPATPPPPPPRAQTASPSVARPSTASPPPGLPRGPPLSPRPASTMGNGPPKAPPPRARSNLVPTDDESGSVPSTPPPPSGLSTPPSRPKSQASGKRNIRSRYVDVFQQQ